MKNTVWIFITMLVATLAGCLHETSFTGNSTNDAPVDRHRAILAAMGLEKGDVDAFYDARGRYTYPSDTVFRIQGDIILTKANLEAIEAKNAMALGKSSQTRWNITSGVYATLDVKSLDEVAGINLFIWDGSSSAVGPNWAQAIRDAIQAWNDLPATAVRFTEVFSSTDAEVYIYADTLPSNILGETNPQPNPWLYGTSVRVNASRESNLSLSPSTKTALVVHELGHVINIMHTNQIGTVLGSGTYTHIAGTPTSDPASQFTANVQATPIFTSGDIEAVQILYPAYAITARMSDGSIRSEGGVNHGSTFSEYQRVGDTLFLLQNDGSLYMRLPGETVGTYLLGDVLSFKYSKGVIGAIVNASPNEFWARDLEDGEWEYQASNISKIDVEDNRLAYLSTSNDLYVKNPIYGGSFGSAVASGGISEFALEGNRIAMIQYTGGVESVYSQTGPTINSGGWTQYSPSGYNSGYLFGLQLEGNRMGAQDTYGYIYFWDGPNTSTYHYGSKYQLEGNRIAWINPSGQLIVRDGLIGTMYTVSNNVQDFQLTKGFVSLITGNRLYGKALDATSNNALHSLQQYLSSSPYPTGYGQTP